MTLLKQLSAIALTAVSATAFATCPTKKTGEQMSAAAVEIPEGVSIANTEKASLAVEKMMCGKCRAKITQALNKPELHLKDVQVNLESKTASFVCNAQSCSVTTIQKALLELGYPTRKL